MSRDQIYAAQDGDAPFRFDDSVARVFPDMLRRSIPGYEMSLEAIGSLAARHVRAGTSCYDLGCSLGAASIAMHQGIRVPDCRIIAVDNAPAMVGRCREIVAAETARRPGGADVEVIEGDIREVEFSNASMVVLNYTLQFIDVADRDRLAGRIRDGLNDGGLLVLSEKVVDEDPAIEDLLVKLHHEFKRRNDYSALEVARKRAALENVLVPETITAHRHRLTAAGFRHVGVWLRCFNFVSILAVR